MKECQRHLTHIWQTFDNLYTFYPKDIQMSSKDVKHLKSSATGGARCISMLTGDTWPRQAWHSMAAVGRISCHFSAWCLKMPECTEHVVSNCVNQDFLAPYLLSSIDRGAGMIRMLNETPIQYLTWGNHEADPWCNACDLMDIFMKSWMQCKKKPQSEIPKVGFL